MIIQHNMQSITSQRQLGITTKSKAVSQEKLASGYRINRAADDAAGLAISEKMRYQIRGLDRGLKNTSDGISLVQVADGAMSEVHSIIHRMEELAVQAANGTNSVSDRKAINEEVQKLKDEINRIGGTTMFNGQNVFDQENGSLTPPTLRMNGRYFAYEDINVYNSEYDAETGEVKYGGLILDGKRISWTDISPDMVYLDADGKHMFRGGNYHFQMNNITYSVQCSDGAEVPRFGRESRFYGDADFFYLGREKHPWSDFVDENGMPLSMNTIHSGDWRVKGTDTTISLSVSEDSNSKADIGDVMAAADAGLITRPQYFINEAWAGAVETIAMETTGARDITIPDRTVAKNIIDRLWSDGAVNYRVRAGKEETGDPVKTEEYSHNGIWLEEWKEVDAYDEDGNRIPVYTVDGGGNKVQKKDAQGNPVWEKITRWVQVDDSIRTWEDVGLKDDEGEIWKSTAAIRHAVDQGIEFEYEDNDGTNDTSVRFSFVLDAEVTSLDSVIDGLDKTITRGDDLRTSYSADLEVAEDDNILRSYISTGATPGRLVTAEEEYRYNRDYAAQQVDKVASAEGIVAGQSVSFSYMDAEDPNATVAKYTGETSDQIARMKTMAGSYLDYVIKEKEAALIRGTETSIAGVVGKNNITPDGTLSETVTIGTDAEGWVITNGGSPRAGSSLIAGKTYGCARVDFKDVQDIMDLAGTGIDNTCGFCTDHYSVRFTSGNTSGYSTITDENGKALKYKLTSSNPGHFSGHFTMDIDLDSIRDAGYTQPEEYTKAFVRLLSGTKSYHDEMPVADGLDFHYTQFAAHGTTLYVVNNQPDIDTVHTDSI